MYTGVAEIIILGPLFLLLFIGGVVGAGLGGPRACIAGILTGCVFFLLGVGVLGFFGRIDEDKRIAEVNKEYLVWSNACLNEAGETGHRPLILAKKVFVHFDPRLSEHRLLRDFDLKDGVETVEVVSSIPETLQPEQALIDIRLVMRPIDGVENRRFLAYETVIQDSTGHVFAKRFNPIQPGGGSCLIEAESKAIERFLRKQLRMKQVLLKSSQYGQETISMEYPIASTDSREKLTLRDKGEYAMNGRIRRGKLEEVVPSNWGCVFSKENYYQSSAKCPQEMGESPVENAWASYDAGNTWLIFSKPIEYNGYVGRLVIEERSKEGRVIRKLITRFPPIKEDRNWMLGDVKLHQDSLEMIWLFEANAYGVTKPPKEYSGYRERIRMSIPMSNLNRGSD